jgi:hypothetical protein
MRKRFGVMVAASVHSSFVLLYGPACDSSRRELVLDVR